MTFSREHIPVLDAKGLRKFGLTVGGIFMALFALVPLLRGHDVPKWPLVVGGLFIVPALVFPSLLGPVHRVWMRIGQVLGAINTRIILGLFYFVLLVPVALVFRAMGRNPLRLGYDKAATSYRVKVTLAPGAGMQNPF